MQGMLTEEQGKRLIELARKTISLRLEEKEIDISDLLKKEFSEKRGAFVTLTSDEELRGCIGVVEAIYPLWETIVHAAESAAFGDPRFGPLEKEEFGRVKVEISVLTEPKLIEVKEASDYLKDIKTGKDGLIIEGVYGKGLLLPQVATEWKWDAKEFLEHTCEKAGLDRDAWKDLDNKIYKFQAQIFSE
ncbi:AmmeMemoRadiSam system protein A [Candidatus Woesearchaeota archaeon]|nr:AmmeMemoRadiSam system protein A [Candidatus Woesearchaeota archaeon]